MNFRLGAPGLANPAAGPHPAERARTLTRMAGVLNQALVKRLVTRETHPCIQPTVSQVPLHRFTSWFHEFKSLCGFSFTGFTSCHDRRVDSGQSRNAILKACLAMACAESTPNWPTRKAGRGERFWIATELGACPGISIQVTSMDDQSVQVASIRPQCLFAPIPAA